MKDKKKLTAAVTGITSALTKGFDLLNDQGQLPEIPKDDLSMAAFAYQIVRQLKNEISLIEENARFDGLTPEEIHLEKEQERQRKLQELQAESAAKLKELKHVPEPEAELEEGVEDPDADPDAGDNLDPADEPGASDEPSQPAA